MRALTVKEVLKQKKRTFAFKGEWKEAFGEPERTGVWFIWGNSGNGKSSTATKARAAKRRAAPRVHVVRGRIARRR